MTPQKWVLAFGVVATEVAGVNCRLPKLEVLHGPCIDLLDKDELGLKCNSVIGSVMWESHDLAGYFHD